jgi:hypothetical protein
MVEGVPSHVCWLFRQLWTVFRGVLPIFSDFGLFGSFLASKKAAKQAKNTKFTPK